jgi:hypothetical protein
VEIGALQFQHSNGMLLARLFKPQEFYGDLTKFATLGKVQHGVFALAFVTQQLPEPLMHEMQLVFQAVFR